MSQLSPLACVWVSRYIWDSGDNVYMDDNGFIDKNGDNVDSNYIVDNGDSCNNVDNSVDFLSTMA